eukprot:11200251-Lingulodinium_polyedra.AAC.1
MADCYAKQDVAPGNHRVSLGRISAWSPEWAIDGSPGVALGYPDPTAADGGKLKHARACDDTI